MKLYASPLSLFSAKVRIALAEKAVPCEIETVPLHPVLGYHPKHPQVVEHNPKQQVPLLIDADLVLFDSTVIIEYLEDLAPEPALYPRDIRARARCRLLELEADELHFAPIATLIAQRYAIKSGAAPDTAARAKCAAALHAYSLRLARHLGSADYLCGSFSVADIAHFLVVCFATGFELPPSADVPTLHAWFGRVAARPAVAAELRRLAEAARAFDGVSVELPAAVATL